MPEPTPRLYIAPGAPDAPLSASKLLADSELTIPPNPIMDLTRAYDEAEAAPTTQELLDQQVSSHPHRSIAEARSNNFEAWCEPSICAIVTTNQSAHHLPCRNHHHDLRILA